MRVPLVTLVQKDSPWEVSLRLGKVTDKTKEAERINATPFIRNSTSKLIMVIIAAASTGLGRFSRS